MHLSLLLLLAALCLAIGVYARSTGRDGPIWWGLAITVAGLALAGMFVHGGLVGAGLLSAAELAAGALILAHGTPEARAAARRFFMAIVPGVILTLIAVWIVEMEAHAPAPDEMMRRIAICCAMLGFALKLGLAPLYFWVPAVAVAAPTATVMLVIAIVDIAVFAELLHLAGEAPWLFALTRPVWVVLALATMLGGALLAFAQTDLKRMLAFSSITDLGLLVLGASIGGVLGLEGAWIGAMSHALCKVALFGAVGLAERRIGEPVTLETRGLAVAMPVTAGAFVIAAISFIGVPPGFGFAGYWRIYVAAIDFGGLALIAILLCVAAIDLLCYVRAIGRTWLGAPQGATPDEVAPRIAPAILAGIAILCVILGVYPLIATQTSHFLAALM